MKNKKIYICGNKWTLKIVDELDCNADFDFATFTIRFKKNLYTFGVLVHEILEIILCSHFARYYSNSGSQDYLFNFSHTEFMIICDELSGALKQLGMEYKI